MKNFKDSSSNSLESTPPPQSARHKHSAHRYLTPLTLSSLLATTCSTEAAIIYHQFETPISVADSGRSIYRTKSFNIFNNVPGDEVRARQRYSAVGAITTKLFRRGAGLNFYMKGPSATTGDAPKQFAKGDAIAGDRLHTQTLFAGFDSNNSEPGGASYHGNVDWLNPAPGSISGYIGFKATVDSQDIYGWIKVAVRAIGWTAHDTATTRPKELKVLSWGYEPSGDSIVAGAIPEPSTTATALGLLALGAVGIARKRKHKAEIQSS